MGKLRNLQKRAASLTIQRQEKELISILKKHSNIIIQLNQRQLLEGRDSLGHSTGSYVSESYAVMKLRLNPLGVKDYKLTGKFHSSFFVRIESLPFSIYARDSKTKDIVAKAGEDIFGLDKDSKKILAVGYIKEEFQDFYRKVLKL